MGFRVSDANNVTENGRGCCDPTLEQWSWQHEFVVQISATYPKSLAMVMRIVPEYKGQISGRQPVE